MWYLAAIPFAILTGVFIYNLIDEKDVNLAIDDDDKEKPSSKGKGEMVFAGTADYPIIKGTAVEGVWGAKTHPKGSMISVVPTIQTEEEFDLIFRAADQFSGHGLFVALDVLTAKTGIRKGKASKRTTGKKESKSKS